jgi:NAD(P)-dependent dehydrogenase (short-subunit alcohol dehydrogenase family)
MKGQTILITGAANGLGRAWTEGFLAEGATVIAADINEEMLAGLAGESCHTVVTDVSRADQVKAMVEFAIAKTGRLDVLFNNAGMGYGHKIESAPDDAFEQHVAVHLFGCVNGMRAAIPHMRQQGFGRIINTISRGAEVNAPGTSGYAAAKAGMFAASRVAAQEVRDTDILVNMLIPGPTNTSIWHRDRPELQSASVTFPTAKMLATLPAGGPTGRVFWNEQEYLLFDPENEVQQRIRAS